MSLKLVVYLMQLESSHLTHGWSGKMRHQDEDESDFCMGLIALLDLDRSLNTVLLNNS